MHQSHPLPHRTASTRWLLAGLVGLLSLSASAQSWPDKPMRVVVPLPPGGPSDIVLRGAAPKVQQLLGQPLVAAHSDPVEALWSAAPVIVAHGTEADPLFFFANRAALARFETTTDAFTGSPSRLSAEAPLRGERQALLDRVSSHGFIADYAGVRISAQGRRFRIEQAVVWNLLDADGTVHGQAAAFDTWTEL